MSRRECMNFRHVFSAKQHEQAEEKKLRPLGLQRDFAARPGHLTPCSATLSLFVPISSVRSSDY